MASLLLAAAGNPSASSAQAVRGAPPRIGSIQKLFLEDSDCSCNLYLPERRLGVDEHGFDKVQVPLVFAEADLKDQAQMNIDGRDVMLRLVRYSPRVGRRGPLRVGDRSVKVYEGEGVRVRVVSTITEVCPRNEPTCETLSNSAVITVTKGGRARSVRASGGCSC